MEVYADERRDTVLTKFHMLRQQSQKSAGEFNKSLADFIAPRETGLPDYIGGFAVTAGIGAEELSAKFKAEHDDYNAIMVSALADRLAEAFAERLHQIAREDWGYGKTENLTNDDLIRERYRGIRPAPGYPACPDHTERKTIFDLLDVEKIGIYHTESMAMHPEARCPAGFWRTRRPIISQSERSSATRWRSTRRARAWRWRRWSGGCRRT